MLKYILSVLLIGTLFGCSAPDLNQPGKVSKSKVDEHGVVCYTTVFRGEFSCVKVK